MSTQSVGSVSGKVFSIAAHRQRNKNWTQVEHELLMLALRHLAFRGKAHYPEYFTDDQGNPCVAFTAGYHVDASYSVSKVDGRYVVLNFEGRCVADSSSLCTALARALCGGFKDPNWAFLYGLDVCASVYEEINRRNVDGSVQA